MKLTPIDQNHVHQTCQGLLAYLSDGRNSTPNDMMESIMSGKSLLRAILTGALVVATQESPEQKKGPEEPPKEE